jgi:hypothetical protein|tara:strand:+ start:683 stop:868 length:186 start_codon:yes stop_codon:yes gene_type:complete
MTGNARSKLRKCNICGRETISTSSKCNNNKINKMSTNRCEGKLEIMGKNPNRNIKKLGDLK